MDPKEAWRAAGLYDPRDPGAAERLALLEYLTERGATMEQMVEAHRLGTLPGVAGRLVTQGSDGVVKKRQITAAPTLIIKRVSRAGREGSMSRAASGSAQPL